MKNFIFNWKVPLKWPKNMLLLEILLVFDSATYEQDLIFDTKCQKKIRYIGPIYTQFLYSYNHFDLHSMFVKPGILILITSYLVLYPMCICYCANTFEIRCK